MSLHLNSRFGGLRLASPVIVGACPISMNEHTRLAMQNAGAGAIVLPSLFEEQVIQWSQKLGRPVTDREHEILAMSKRTEHQWVCRDAETYLALVNRASTLQGIPIIASLNGFTAGGWMDFAGELQDAGAAAIELNVHHGRACDYESSAEIETKILDAVRDINAAIRIPLIVKLGRNFTSIPHMARQMLSGVSGMVLHARAPTVDLCLDTLKLTSRWRLTRSEEEPESLDMLMRVHAYCPAMPLAASGGIGHADHLIKALASGADVAMITSAIYREGPDVIRNMLDGLTRFMESHHLQSMLDLQTQRPLQFSSAEERAAYISALNSRVDTTQTQPSNAALHADRWGHSIL